MNIDNLGLGRLPSVDDRDKKHLMASLVPEIIPTVKYRYYRTGPVLDQGDTPQCVGYSWRQWLSSAPLMTKTGPDATLIYHEAQKVDEWPGEDYDGTSVRGAAKFLQGLGHIDRYVWAFNATDVKNYILANLGSVVLGTDWYYDMFFPDPKTGFVKVSGKLAGGHAYLCIGYSDILGAFRFINSWGSSWGQSGRFWIAGEDLDRLIAAQGEACTATEKKVPVKSLLVNISADATGAASGLHAVQENLRKLEDIASRKN